MEGRSHCNVVEEPFDPSGRAMLVPFETDASAVVRHLLEVGCYAAVAMPRLA